MNQDISIIFGKHSVFEALKNPERIIFNVYILKNKIDSNDFNQIQKLVNSRIDSGQIKIQILEKLVFERAIYGNINKSNKKDQKKIENINHQGIFLEAKRLVEANIFKFLESEAQKSVEFSKIVVLDHVLDSSNIGSIIRLCVAFKVDLLILTKDHCPDFQNSSILKIASGAVENLKISVVVNLASTIDLLKKYEYWVYGLTLDHKEKNNIYNLKFSKKSVLIMGSEEKGLRKLTGQKIDFAVYIPISEKIQSLNVSTALGISLFEIERQKFCE